MLPEKWCLQRVTSLLQEGAMVEEAIAQWLLEQK